MCLSVCLLGLGIFLGMCMDLKVVKGWHISVISPSLSGSLSFKQRYFTSVSCSQPLTMKYNIERIPILDVSLVL